MKQNMKRVLLVLCVVTCLFSLSACSKKAAQETPLDPMQIATLEQSATNTLQQLAIMSEEQLAASIVQAEKDKDILSITGLQSWQSAQADLGAFVSIDSTEAGIGEEGFVVDVRATFEKRTLTFHAGVNEDMTQYTSWSFTPDFSVVEKMEKAALNTLMGMGTVFAVLIFISLLIGCFRYINIWETKMKNRGKEKAVPEPTLATTVLPVEGDPEDDLELAAVITAAIAAATGASPDGLVVRSIRRAPVGKWKKA